MRVSQPPLRIVVTEAKAEKLALFFNYMANNFNDLKFAISLSLLSALYCSSGLEHLSISLLSLLHPHSLLLSYIVLGSGYF